MFFPLPEKLEDTQPHYQPKPMHCKKCGKELTRELDAYYGRDVYLSFFCTKCRRTA